MPLYRGSDLKFRFKALTNNPLRQGVLRPRATAQLDGIYACSLCGLEIVRRAGELMPPEPLCGGHGKSSEEETLDDGVIRWMLVAIAQNALCTDLQRLTR